MARVKIGAPLTGIRGTIGGITFSQNATATYAKAWSGPRRNGTRLASKSRCVFGRHGNAWRDLDQSDRDDWDDYAALPAQELTNSLGEAYYASGWNWFASLNSRLAWIERSAITTPPAGARPAAPTISSVTLEASGGGDSSAITYPEDEFDGLDFILFGRLWLSQGAVARTAGFFLILATQTPGATETNIQSEIESVFGTIPEDARLFASVHAQDSDGQRSQPTADYGDS